MLGLAIFLIFFFLQQLRAEHGPQPLNTKNQKNEAGGWFLSGYESCPEQNPCSFSYYTVVAIALISQSLLIVIPGMIFWDIFNGKTDFKNLTSFKRHLLLLEAHCQRIRLQELNSN